MADKQTYRVTREAWLYQTHYEAGATTEPLTAKQAEQPLRAGVIAPLVVEKVEKPAPKKTAKKTAKPAPADGE